MSNMIPNLVIVEWQVQPSVGVGFLEVLLFVVLLVLWETAQMGSSYLLICYASWFLAASQ